MLAGTLQRASSALTGLAHAPPVPSRKANGCEERNPIILRLLQLLANRTLFLAGDSQERAHPTHTRSWATSCEQATLPSQMYFWYADMTTCVVGWSRYVVGGLGGRQARCPDAPCTLSRRAEEARGTVLQPPSPPARRLTGVSRILLAAAHRKVRLRRPPSRHARALRASWCVAGFIRTFRCAACTGRPARWFAELIASREQSLCHRAGRVDGCHILFPRLHRCAGLLREGISQRAQGWERDEALLPSRARGAREAARVPSTLAHSSPGIPAGRVWCVQRCEPLGPTVRAHRVLEPHDVLVLNSGIHFTPAKAAEHARATAEYVRRRLDAASLLWLAHSLTGSLPARCSPTPTGHGLCPSCSGNALRYRPVYRSTCLERKDVLFRCSSHIPHRESCTALVHPACHLGPQARE